MINVVKTLIIICILYQLRHVRMLALLLCTLSAIITSQILSTYRVWKARVRIQVFRGELHTHIHLDYTTIEFLSCIYIYI